MSAKEQKVEAKDLDKEIADLDTQIAALEAERAGMPPVPTWEELQDAGVLTELQAREARRGLLPHLLRAARIKHLELRRGKEQAEIAPLRESQQEAYERLESAQAEKIRAEEKLGEARHAHSDATLRIQARETRIRHINRQIEELKG